MASHRDPVFRGREQEAAEDGPAEAEEHFVGVPLQRGNGGGGQGEGAGKDGGPQQGQAQAGQAGEGEEGAKAHQPQRVFGKFHDGVSAWAGQRQLAGPT